MGSPVITLETGTHIAKQLLEGMTLREWEPKLDHINGESAMWFSVMCNKAYSIKDTEKRKKMEEKILAIGLAEVSIGAKRANKFSDTVVGYFLLMNMRRKNKNFDGDNINETG